MDDDDDYVDIDIDEIVQAHTNRGAGQGVTDPGSSQVVRTELPPAPAGPPTRSNSTGALLPPYSSHHKYNFNAPGVDMAARTIVHSSYSGHTTYGGQPQKPPQGPGGSLFQHTHHASRTGSGNSNHLIRPQFNTGNAVAEANSSSSGATVPPTSSGAGALQASAHALAAGSKYQAPQISSTTSAGALHIIKPRSLGQQLGFGALNSGPGIASGTQGLPYYGAPFSVSNNAAQGGTGSAGGTGGSHVMGTHGPVGGVPNGTITRTVALPASTASPMAPSGAATNTSNFSKAITGPVGGSGAAPAGPLDGPAATGANLNPPSGSTYADSGGRTAAPPAGPPHWTGGGAAGGAQAPLVMSQRAPGGYSSPIAPGPGPLHSDVVAGGGPYSGSGFGGEGGGGPLGPALHMQGPDVNALRAHNNALEAQVEALKRQLQDSVKLAKGAQSLQEQLQHAQAETQELQRKHREAALRLQEERSRGEVAERERKEAQDKSLMLEAELHKARASSSATGAMRTPPPKQKPSPGAGAKRPRHGPEPHYERQQLQQSHRDVQQQQQGITDVDAAEEGVPAGPPVLGSSAAATAEQQKPQGTRGGGASAAEGCTAAAASTSSAVGMPMGLFLTTLEDLRAARLPLWQRLWCACPDSLTILLHPTAPDSAAAVAAAVAAAAAVEEQEDGSSFPGPGLRADAVAISIAAGLAPLPGIHHTGSQLSQPAQWAFTQIGLNLRPGGDGGDGHDGSDSGGRGLDLQERCMALVEGVRVQLQALSAGREDGLAVLLGVLSLLQAATDRPGGEGARESAHGGGRPGAGGAARPVAAGAATPEEPNDDTEPHQEQELQQAQRDREQELLQQRAALWPLVGPCVDLLAGLLVHSDACRTALSAGSAREAVSPSSFHSCATAAPTAMPAAATAARLPGFCGRCPGELRRGGLPYLLIPTGVNCPCIGNGSAVATAAEAARAERRRQLRSYVYGDGSSRDGGSKGAFDPGGPAAGYTRQQLQADGQQRAADGPVVLGAADAKFQEVGETSYGTTHFGVLGEAVGSLWDLVQLLMDVASCCDHDDDKGARIAPAECGGSGVATIAAAAVAVRTGPPIDVLVCVAAALKAIGAMLPAASSRSVLLPALTKPLQLLVPLMCRTTTPPRLAAICLLHLLMESPSCVAAAATALGVPGYACRAGVLKPAAAVQLFTALLDALEPDELWPDWIAGRGSEGGDGDGNGRSSGGGGGDDGFPHNLPRLTLSLLAMLLDMGHDALVGALCCPSWLEGYGLPLRLLALADAACTPPGSEDPLEPVYPAPPDPALDIVSGTCVPPAEWLQRLRVAQEALILLKELLTGGGEETRRAALQDLASSSSDSDSQQLVELATSRLGSWPRCPPDLLQVAIGRETGLALPELAPWAARITLGGGGSVAARTGVGTLCRSTSSVCNDGMLVFCSVEAVGALAGSVRRRWEHWQMQQS